MKRFIKDHWQCIAGGLIGTILYHQLHGEYNHIVYMQEKAEANRLRNIVMVCNYYSHIEPLQQHSHYIWHVNARLDNAAKEAISEVCKP